MHTPQENLERRQRLLLRLGGLRNGVSIARSVTSAGMKTTTLRNGRNLDSTAPIKNCIDRHYTDIFLGAFRDSRAKATKPHKMSSCRQNAKPKTRTTKNCRASAQLRKNPRMAYKSTHADTHTKKTIHTSPQRNDGKPLIYTGIERCGDAERERERVLLTCAF